MCYSAELFHNINIEKDPPPKAMTKKQKPPRRDEWRVAKFQLTNFCLLYYLFKGALYASSRI